MSYGQGSYCDSLTLDQNSQNYTTSPDWFGPGWYRFQLPAGVDLILFKILIDTISLLRGIRVTLM